MQNAAYKLLPTFKMGCKEATSTLKDLLWAKNGCCQDYCDVGVGMHALTFPSIQQKGVVQLSCCRQTSLVQD